MKSVNLIPAPRLATRRCRAHRNLCVVACAAYAAMAVGVCLGARVVWGDIEGSLVHKLGGAAAEVDRAAKAIEAAKADLGVAEATLRSSRSITEQPDWSALLALLAVKAGDDVVLKGCQVSVREAAKLAADAKGARPKLGAGAVPAVPESNVVLNLSGLGRSQPAVSQFVLRLEATGLFAKVTMVDTSREGFLNGTAIAFRIECSLDDPAGGTKR